MVALIIALSFVDLCLADFNISPDPFSFGDQDTVCDTHVSVMDNNGADSIVVGGYT